MLLVYQVEAEMDGDMNTGKLYAAICIFWTVELSITTVTFEIMFSAASHIVATEMLMNVIGDNQSLHIQLHSNVKFVMACHETEHLV